MDNKTNQLKIKIFADGAEKEGILELSALSHIKGFTTNPTLMRKAGITNYVGFAKDILELVKDKPISFEVFSDDFDEMEKQASIINSWASNVYVKIPITNTKGQSSSNLIKKLSAQGIKVNVTAILTLGQVESAVSSIASGVPAVISVFAGRIADTGTDPVPLMKLAKDIIRPFPNIELLWASPRELLNIFQAESAGADIITIPHDILKKIEKVGYDHEKLSLDTVKMFYEDGQKAGFIFP